MSKPVYITDSTNTEVDLTDGTVVVTVDSSALPTGAATEAKQDTGNASLATIAGDTTSIDGEVVETQQQETNESATDTDTAIESESESEPGLPRSEPLIGPIEPQDNSQVDNKSDQSDQKLQCN